MYTYSCSSQGFDPVIFLKVNDVLIPLGKIVRPLPPSKTITISDFLGVMPCDQTYLKHKSCYNDKHAFYE